jgi:hypothetical protein
MWFMKDFELDSTTVVTGFHSKHNNVCEFGDIRDFVRCIKNLF